jgi:hypothetical protein
MSRAVLYQKLLKAAAKQLGVKPSSESAKDLAVLRLARETITSKLISGRDVDPSALRWLVEELAKFAPPPETPKVTVEIVEGITGICPVCKAEVHPWEPPPAPPPSPSSTPPPTEDGPSTPSAPAASNVVELPRRNPGSIHAAVLLSAARPPLKKYQAANPAASYGTSNPFSAGPMPDWGAAHSLPPIPPERFPK